MDLGLLIFMLLGLGWPMAEAEAGTAIATKSRSLAPARQQAAGGDEADDEGAADVASQAFDDKQFLRALRYAPGRYWQLGGVDQPELDYTNALRTRNGVPGTSRLKEFANAISASVSRNLDTFGVRLNVASLESGTPDPATAIGSPGPRRASPTTGVTAYEPALFWQRQSDHAPYLEIGTTPINGVLPPTLEGRAGAHLGADWSLNGGIYRQAVTDSILSYTGLVDPGTGLRFGRVVESGLQAEFELPFHRVWSLDLGGSWGIDSGRRVQYNNHLSTAAGLNYGFTVAGFDNLGLGPVVHYDHYLHNLSGFTSGNGGYFSPQSWQRLGIELEAQTAELRSIVAHVNVTPEWSGSRQRSLPVQKGFGLSADVELLCRLTPHLAAGGVFSMDSSPQYRDFYGGIAGRFNFGHRHQLLTSDLPASPVR